MFSVLSRFTKPGDGKKSNAPSPMSSSLQKKFSRGVDYNMKILIKGDRNVGKSCLLQRLQGGPFIEEYQPTDQIQVAPIHWKYKDTEHIIKVEVWEVVDKGRVKKKGSSNLKLDNSNIPPTFDALETPPLDATFLDVYVNANGVIMMMDITKPWTFEYVKREISTVPGDIPIIILGNHCDMHHHREINQYQVELFMTTAKQSRAGALRYAETSMRNGFGLRLLHKFLNIPFLQLQRTTLLNQLSVNNQETRDAFSELDDIEKSEVTDYEAFVEKLTSKRKQEIGASTNNVPRINSDKSPSIVLGAGKPIIPPNINPLAQSSIIPNKQIQQTLQSINMDLSQNTASIINNNNNGKNSSNINKLHDRSNSNIDKITSTPQSAHKTKDDIDDFCPGDLDHSFLDDLSPTNKNFTSNEIVVPNYSIPVNLNLDSDSGGEDGINPLVTGIQDDFASSDDDNNTNKKNKISTKMTDLTETPKSSSKADKIPFLTNIQPFDESIVDKTQTISLEPISNGPKFEREYNKYPYDTHLEVDQYDSGYELNQPVGYDSSPTWPLNTSERRSPEGGEGVSPSAEIKKESKQKEEKKHKKSKKSSKDKDKSHKEKDGERSKEKKHKEKKHRKKGSDEYMEDFLNGSSIKTEHAREAYEDL